MSNTLDFSYFVFCYKIKSYKFEKSNVYTIKIKEISFKFFNTLKIRNVFLNWLINHFFLFFEEKKYKWQHFCWLKHWRFWTTLSLPELRKCVLPKLKTVQDLFIQRGEKLWTQVLNRPRLDYFFHRGWALPHPLGVEIIIF